MFNNRMQLAHSLNTATDAELIRIACVGKCLYVCTAIGTSNWSVCSCLCFSSSTLVSFSLASSSLDLSSSDSWRIQKQDNNNDEGEREKAQLKRGCRDDQSRLEERGVGNIRQPDNETDRRKRNFLQRFRILF